MLLSTIRTGLTSRLEQVDGMTVGDFPSTAPPVPYAWFGAPSAEYNATMGRGSDDFAYTIRVAVSHADLSESVREVEQYMSGHGDSSIRAALEDDTATGDVLAGLSMVRVDSAVYGSESASDGTSYTSIAFTVVVTVDGRT